MIPNNEELEKFYELHGKYYHHFVAIGLKYGWSIEDLKDIISQMFLDLIEKNIQIATIAHPKAFLTTVFRRKLIDNARKNNKESGLRQQISYLSATEEYENYRFEEDSELQKKIQTAYAKLPPRCRKVIFLTFYRGLSTEEIRRQLGLSSRTVYNNLFEALKLLRTSISKRDVVPAFLLLYYF